MADETHLKYKEARKKVESVADDFIDRCRSNGLTLKEMQILSLILQEKIKMTIDTALYETRLL